MNENNQNDTNGQGGIDSETERRNRENETGQQSASAPTDAGQGGQSQNSQAQGGQTQDSQSQDSQSQGGQSQSGQPQFGQSEGGDTGSGFVGSSPDQSSDYLTEGENQNFQPEGQGATDTDAGNSDIETGQSRAPDATLDDGSDTSR